MRSTTRSRARLDMGPQLAGRARAESDSRGTGSTPVDSGDLVVDANALAEEAFQAELNHARTTAIRLGLRHLADEFASVACVAVVEAARRFDPSRGAPFSAYAAARVDFAIRDYLRAVDLVSRSQRRLAKRASAAEFVGSDTSASGGAGGTSLTRAALDEGRRLRRDAQVLSLDEIASAELASDESADAEVRADVSFALEGLPARTRYIMTEVYLAGRTMEQVGADLGINESRVRQICANGRIAMRRALAASPESRSLD